MITRKTPDDIAGLGQTIATASEELERVFHQLTVEADRQLVAAAQAFIAEQANATLGPLCAAYAATHERLLKSAVAASNIRELWEQSKTLRSKCTWWRGVMESRQRSSDIRTVCEGATPQEPADGPAARPREAQKVSEGRHPGSLWIDTHRQELPVNEWVAAGKDGLVAHDASIDVVYAKVAEQGIEPHEVAIAFIDEPGPALVRQ